jgi:glutathione S-transferase
VYQHSFAGLSMDSYPSTKRWLESVAALKEIKAAYEKVPKGKEM